jgi:hypothetical protein
MKLSRKLPLLALTGILTGLLSASASPRAAPAATVSAFACPACTSATRCELVHGSGSTGCSVKAATGCVEELGICVCGNCEGYAADVPGNRIERDTPFGRLTLRTVGENRYAAWSCTGELIYLAERGPDGKVSELPVAAYRTTYDYRHVAGAEPRSGA